MPNNLEYRIAFKAIHDVLIKEWDPIGVRDEPHAQDEYDSYVPVIFRLITEGATDDAIADHLSKLETVEMGLSSDLNHNFQIVGKLRTALAWNKK